MKSSVKYIGVIDHSGKKHTIEFYDGVNVITGRSSTGKSAIIEIFDYCFGKDDNTIPHGVITENAELYFCVMSVNDGYLVLARKAMPKTAFLRYESSMPSIEGMTRDYFSNEYFLTLNDFKNALNSYFNLKVFDTDEDLEARSFRKYNAKAPCASVRHFVSFMLQHQNMIANKHALFYRFDEKEKRDQTIDQFKIFLGFVDQEYYLKKQELAEAERTLKKLNLRKEMLDKNSSNVKNSLIELLNQYEYITGKKLITENVDQLVSNPANSLDIINAQVVVADDNTEVFANQYDNLKKTYDEIDSEIQQKNLELGRIQVNINSANKYKDSLNGISSCDSAYVTVSECPFCKNQNKGISKEVNKLQSAIEWLNSELQKTPVLAETFLVKQKELKQERDELKKTLSHYKELIADMENVQKQAKERKSRYEQAVNVKERIAAIIQEKLIGSEPELLNEIGECEKSINRIRKFLIDNYNIDNKMKSAEIAINKNMNAIGEKLDFEQAYKPVNLNFSLETFDLHFNIKGESVYLRSVGSGANWLACHISLFTGLIKYFCQQGSSCLIPPILFLDQPSQVYFPTSTDIASEFDAKKLKEAEGKEEQVDADLKSVTNLYQQLVKFCKETFKETNIMPQIIITDHADNLKLEDCDFDKDLVRGRRWRAKNEGFIKLINASTFQETTN